MGNVDNRSPSGQHYDDIDAADEADYENQGHHRVEEDLVEETATDLETNVKQDRVIVTTNQDKVDGNNSSSTSTATNKFSFLQWFNAQLNNVKLSQNRPPPINSTTPLIPSSQSTGTSSTTRFFTLKPTAVSYSGIQPILRPKPWEDNSTESPATAVRESSPSATVTELVLSAMNRTVIEATAAVLPRPFQVQTTLNLAREPLGKLVESPRSQKSISLMVESLTTPRMVRRDRQQQVELLKDFFPPVRRPVSRPQITKKGIEGNNQAASLPIESLFTSTLKPAAGHLASGHQHRSNTNSPIYTFKLNQGQSVHDVLSQLLADLTVGDSPADVEVDGAAPSLLREKDNVDNGDDVKTLKASNKKVDDDRFKPWAHTPFRPAILNALYNTRHNSSGTLTTATNVEVSTQINSPSVPVLVTGEVTVTTEMANPKTTIADSTSTGKKAISITC